MFLVYICFNHILITDKGWEVSPKLKQRHYFKECFIKGTVIRVWFFNKKIAETWKKIKGFMCQEGTGIYLRRETFGEF